MDWKERTVQDVGPSSYRFSMPQEFGRKHEKAEIAEVGEYCLVRPVDHGEVLVFEYEGTDNKEEMKDELINAIALGADQVYFPEEIFESDSEKEDKLDEITSNATSDVRYFIGNHKEKENIVEIRESDTDFDDYRSDVTLNLLPYHQRQLTRSYDPDSLDRRLNTSEFLWALQQKSKSKEPFSRFDEERRIKYVRESQKSDILREITRDFNDLLHQTDALSNYNMEYELFCEELADILEGDVIEVIDESVDGEGDVQGFGEQRKESLERLVDETLEGSGNPEVSRHLHEIENNAKNILDAPKRLQGLDSMSLRS